MKCCPNCFFLTTRFCPVVSLMNPLSLSILLQPLTIFMKKPFRRVFARHFLLDYFLISCFFYAIRPSDKCGTGCFFLCLPVVSSSSPCMFRVKSGRLADGFCLVKPAFGKTCFTVSWFASCGFEWDHCGLAAIGAFDFEHTSLQLITSSAFEV